jgi:magnesium-transporting ATPase (P-type)
MLLLHHRHRCAAHAVHTTNTPTPTHPATHPPTRTHAHTLPGDALAHIEGCGLAAKVIPLVQVFARVSPEQKELVMMVRHGRGARREEALHPD